MNTQLFRRLLLLLSATALLPILGGCAGQPRHAVPSPPMTPTQAYTEPEQRYNNPGSLFSASESTDLYADNRGRRVGDIILIKVVENSKSKSKADTTSSKDAKSSIGVEAAFGRKTISPLFMGGGPVSGGVGVDPMLSTNRSSSLNTTGETKRENYVTATIGARVLQVLPGGVLQVQGAREIRVNEETQYMVVSGLVRAQDVDADNSVESTQLADSRIEYYGEGGFDKQKPGWLVRLLDAAWPF